MSILIDIAQATKQRIAQERLTTPDAVLITQAQTLAEEERRQGPFMYPFEQALAQPGMSCICEVKKASPSKGIIAHNFPYLAIAREYEQAGATALSCLTEPYWFKGANEYLRAITREVTIPVLRKDFTVDERMIYEAKVLGASAVLLICSLLSDEQLTEYIEIAHMIGLSALVETHNEQEIHQARHAGSRIIGVNNRNLATFDVDTTNSLHLRRAAGNDILFVSESGITTRNDVVQLERIGVDAILVGEALMRSANKTATLAALLDREVPEGSDSYLSNNPSSNTPGCSNAKLSPLPVCADSTTKQGFGE